MRELSPQSTSEKWSQCSSRQWVKGMGLFAFADFVSGQFMKATTKRNLLNHRRPVDYGRISPDACSYAYTHANPWIDLKYSGTAPWMPCRLWSRRISMMDRVIERMFLYQRSQQETTCSVDHRREKVTICADEPRPAADSSCARQTDWAQLTFLPGRD